MKHTLSQVFHSGKFVVGFATLAVLLLFTWVYPMFVKAPPMQIIGKGTFFPPGIYVNVYDSIAAKPYSLNIRNAEAKRIASKLSQDDRAAMKDWLVLTGMAADQIDTTDTAKLLDLWAKNYDRNKNVSGLTNAKRNYYIRLDNSLKSLMSPGEVTSTAANGQAGAPIDQSAFVNVGQVANVRVLPLGTDNFGRDVLAELIAAVGVSLTIGIVAGLVATTIGLTLGLVAGYIGGRADDVIMFFTNLFIVIPTMVLLILISFSIGQEKRGALTIAIVIGLTSWTWTARSVRAQVMSLRNRDHVNLSKISGHSTAYIIVNDILPYILSYVVMALILQISSAIIIEATLAVIGLGPRTTEVPTLGNMMNWAMIYQAHNLGYWWAWLPVLLVIALLTFSMNLMQTGLDQVFNPALRD